MRPLYLTLTLLFLLPCYAQTNPTLGVGLETLTMNRGTIDVEALTEIIMEKQKELKGEALKRFMFKMFPEANYTTKHYVQNCLNLLLNEKNPEVIEKEILELTTNYALALGVAYALMKAEDTLIKTINKEYQVYMPKRNPYGEDVVGNYVGTLKKIRGNKVMGYYYQNNLLKKEFERNRLKQKLDKALELFYKEKIQNSNDYNTILRGQKKLKKIDNNIFKIKQRRGLSSINDTYKTIKDNAVYIHSNFDSLGRDQRELYKKNFKELEQHLLRFNLKRLLNLADTICAKSTTNEYCVNIKSSIEIMGQAARNDYNEVNNDRDLPFGNLLDVVSLSLSDMEALKKKGFFKNKVDYTKGDFYIELGDSEDGRIFQRSLDRLKDSICSKIKPYIDHYDVIKDLIHNTKIQDKTAIIQSLKGQAAQLLKNEQTNLSDDIHPIVEYIVKLNSELLLINSLENQEKLLQKVNLPPGAITESDIRKIQQQINIINKSVTIINKTTDSIKSIADGKIERINNPQSFFNVIPKDNSDTISTQRLNSYSGDEYFNNIIANSSIETFLIIDSVKVINEKIDSLRIIQQQLLPLKKKIEQNIDLQYDTLVNQPDFYKNYIESILQNIVNEHNLQSRELDSSTVSKASILFADVYSRLESISRTEKIILTDINHIEQQVSKMLIELKVRDSNSDNDSLYSYLLSKTKVLVPLLKIKALQGLKMGKYEPELMTLFEFIANLDNLDKAKTFTSVVDMLREGSEKVEKNLQDGEFKQGYLIFINGMKKYTLINTEKNYVQVDVASFLNDMKTYYDRKNTSVFSLYLSLGLNENFFLSDHFVIPGTEEKIDYIGFASEKLGVEVRLHSFKKYKGYRNVIKDDIYLNEKAPFVNSLHGIIYGSGLLYSLANTATNENFDFAHVGAGFGIRFYNALDANVTIGFPFVKDIPFGDNAFIGVGLDIPLGEYLEKIGGK